MGSIYWLDGKRRGKRFSGMVNAQNLLLDSDEGMALVEMYNRYVDRWNDVELDHAKPLDLHEHKICGLSTVGSTRSVLLLWGEPSTSNIVIEMNGSFAKSWGKGLSTRRCHMIAKDFRSIYVHYGADCDIKTLRCWLVLERDTYGLVNRYQSVINFLKAASPT